MKVTSIFSATISLVRVHHMACLTVGEAQKYGLPVELREEGNSFGEHTALSLLYLVTQVNPKLHFWVMFW